MSRVLTAISENFTKLWTNVRDYLKVRSSSQHNHFAPTLRGLYLSTVLNLKQLVNHALALRTRMAFTLKRVETTA